MSIEEDYIQENYTFTKETLINNELDSCLTLDFYNKNNVTEVLRGSLEFLQASGYPYITKLIAVKDNGEELSSDDDISAEILDILSRVVEELDTSKPKKKPNLEVVYTNDNNSKPTDSS